MEFLNKAAKDKHVIEDGKIKTIDKKGIIHQAIFIKKISWIWSTSDSIVFNGSTDKMFYLQNCEKKDINGHYLIYDLVKDNGIIRKETFGYTGYRCSISSTGRYTVNSTWNSTFLS